MSHGKAMSLMLSMVYEHPGTNVLFPSTFLTRWAYLELNNNLVILTGRRNTARYTLDKYNLLMRDNAGFVLWPRINRLAPTIIRRETVPFAPAIGTNGITVIGYDWCDTPRVAL